MTVIVETLSFGNQMEKVFLRLVFIQFAIIDS